MMSDRDYNNDPMTAEEVLGSMQLIIDGNKRPARDAGNTWILMEMEMAMKFLYDHEAELEKFLKNNKEYIDFWHRQCITIINKQDKGIGV